MAITEQNVRHLSKLAAISLNDSEVANMARELEAIVGYVQQLQDVDTTGIEPIANVSGAVNITRVDHPVPMLKPAEVLSNAPQKNEVAFLVPKVVER